jgi:class 3 adenylate cyclase
MSLPETQYVKTPGGYVAYQVFGEGDLDILFISSWLSNLDVMWQIPSLADYLNQLATSGRVICFDKRGSGVSDPVPLASIPTLEEWMDDAREVLDAVGSQNVMLIGDGEGGFMATLFAATYSRRVSALVLINAIPRWTRDEDYSIGYPKNAAAKLMKEYERYWGTGMILLLTAPSMITDVEFRKTIARYERLSMSPGVAVDLYKWIMALDVRSVLPSIRCPVLILHRKDNDHYRIQYGRYLHEHIPGSKLIELEGADCHPFFAGDTSDILEEVQMFLTGVEIEEHTNRELTTIMFTDIVESTRQAAELGDHQWIDKLEAHNGVVRRNLRQYRGSEVETTGDGFLATFDGPARAIQCAKRIREEMRSLQLQLRIGLHTGELEFKKGIARGIALHLASRVMSSAGNNEIWVSRTVKDLVIGSGFEFSDQGAHELKGIPDSWQLYAVAE